MSPQEAASEGHASMREVSGVSVPGGTADADFIGKRRALLSSIWYNLRMNPIESPSAPATYRGHVKNGVVVLDTEVTLTEGQEVRVEPIQPKLQPLADSQAAKLEEMKRLFAQWDEEDRQLSDEEADLLQIALEQNRGLSFRTPKLD